MKYIFNYLGLVVSAVGGMLVGVGYFAGIYIATPSTELAMAPDQWKVILTGALAGLLGSIIDSLLGKLANTPPETSMVT